MKPLIIALLLFSPLLSFSQTEIQPYIKTKSNQKITFDQVKSRMFSGCKGRNGDGKYEKFSRKEISSALDVHYIPIN